LLDGAKPKLQSIYDYALIDSRTGVSDTSGICTVEMPETLVVCFRLNNQNIFGAACIVESVRANRPQREFRIFLREKAEILLGIEPERLPEH
jgi:hypothetical protein